MGPQPAKRFLSAAILQLQGNDKLSVNVRVYICQ